MSITQGETQEPLAHIRDRVALVTGGTAGIGAAIGRLLAEEGASVAAGYSRDPTRAEKHLQTMSEAYPGRRITIHQGNIGQANYAASKSGLLGLTKTLARETLFHLNKAEMPPGDGIGLTVNAVTPGFIATDMLATIRERALDRIRSTIPVGRLGRPEEIARVVCFLASDDSSYITGQIWAVNGGLDM